MVVQWGFKSEMGIKKNMIHTIINLIYFPYQWHRHNTQSPSPWEKHQTSSWWRWDQQLHPNTSMSYPSYSLLAHLSKLVMFSSFCTVSGVKLVHLELIWVIFLWLIGYSLAFLSSYWSHQLNILFFMRICHLEYPFALGWF